MSSQHEIDLGYIRIAGKFWGPVHGTPTIALHGYLDNANSFDMIAPHLLGLRTFAMDFAGHGWSDHRAEGSLYSGLNDIRDVLAVADALGWESFNIIGHSMGAEIGSQIAGLFPDRVARIACIDGYCGTDKAGETLTHFQSSIQSSFKRSTSLKTFTSLQQMTHRLCEATGQDETSATCLIERGHKIVEGGYSWRTDPRIRGSGPLELTPDQLEALLDRTTAETLFIVADMQNNWLRRTLDVIEARLAKGKDRNLQLISLPGPHHFHMQSQSDDIASLINKFMDEQLEKIA